MKSATGAPAFRPSSRQVPVLAGEARCQGPARSKAKGRGRRSRPWELSRRQDRPAREDGSAALAGALTGDCVTAGGRADGGCGVTALRQRPAPCVPTLRQRAKLSPHDGEIPLSQPPTTRYPAVQRATQVRSRPLHESSRGRTAWRAEGVPLMLVKNYSPHGAPKRVPQRVLSVSQRVACPI